MNENLIHVKVEYEEAFQSKKDMLSSEMDLLEIIKSIKKYRASRMAELRLKSSLNKKAKETLAEIRKLQAFLPQIRKEKKQAGGTVRQKEPHDKDIESELQDIKEKLRALGA